MLRICLFLAAGIAALSLRPALAAGGVDEVIKSATAECAAIDGGILTVGTNAIQHLDLTGDDIPDALIDGWELSCSSSHTLFCGGTGGCRIFLVVGHKVREEMSKGWELIRFGNMQVLLLQVHGSACGGTNLRSCVKALVWSDGAFRSIGED
ncbi:hypothetical protein [Nisaea sediminum]|uniref:hypothetical protein n=1 Tax=Nisaea sediminum TaxID=2775867 RepID=UPI00186654D5|nr:hypothetical protein [Nisaea sediminum]